MNSVTSLLFKNILKEQAYNLKKGTSLPKVRAMSDRISFRVKVDKTNVNAYQSTQHTSLGESDITINDYVEGEKHHTYFSESNDDDFEAPVAYRKEIISLTMDF